LQAWKYSYGHRSKFFVLDGEVFEDTALNRIPIGKLIYLTIIRSDINFAIGLVSQFMHKLKKVQWKTALRILAYIKGSRKGLYKKNRYMRIKVYLKTM